MTTMVIDYKATEKAAYKRYEIDREEWKTEADLRTLVYECLNETVYLIRVFENDAELFAVRNSH